MTLCQNSAPGSSFQNYSAPSGLVKIVRSIQGAAPLATYSAPSGLVKIVRSIQGAVPLATYYAPLGLKPPDKFRRWADKFRQQAGKFLNLES
mgnify:CR=1 FL=1